MAKNRLINTKFWVDTYVLNELNPIDKLFFLYILTNPYTDISGVYELPLKMAAVESGIDRENIEKVIIPRLEKDGKILYRDGWMAIKNFRKHQVLNPKVKKGMEDGLAKAPRILRDFIEHDSLSYSIYSLSYPKNKNKINTNTKINTKKEKIEPQAALVSEVIHTFEGINPSIKKLYGMPPQRKASERLLETHGLERIQRAVQFLLAQRADRYCPTITTPVQLEDKWAQLQGYYLKLQTPQKRGKGLLE